MTPIAQAIMLAFSGTKYVAPPGEVIFEGSQTQTVAVLWPCPPGVTSVCVLVVAPGGNSGFIGAGGGGGVAWKNNIPVVPGNNYEVYIPAPSISGNMSYFLSVPTVSAVCGGQLYGGYRNIGDGGGTGGDGGRTYGPLGGGGGAAGYTGKGGDGALGEIGAATEGQSGDGGGAGGGAGAQYGVSTTGHGGGVGLFGQGTSGMGGSSNIPHGKSGSNGIEANSSAPGKYGGGARSNNGTTLIGQIGAIRIMWGGDRSFPFNAAKVN